MSTQRSAFSAAFLAAALLATQIDAVRGDTAVITAARDNTLFEDIQGMLSNGAGPSIFAGNNSAQNTRRALVHFELAGAVPAGAAIDSVELHLYVSNAPSETPRIFSVHRALADWGEGSSVSSGGSGAAATAGDATWLHRFYPNSFWASAGGDFDPIPRASTEVGGLGFYSWGGELLTSDVRAWWHSPSGNLGWLIAGDETAASTARRFESREASVPEQRPRLVVHYSMPIPVSPSTWGRIKSLYPSQP
jgi:hypothetical protein